MNNPLFLGCEDRLLLTDHLRITCDCRLIAKNFILGQAISVELAYVGLEFDWNVLVRHVRRNVWVSLVLMVFRGVGGEGVVMRM